MMTQEKKKLTTKFIARAGIFSAFAVLLYFLCKLTPTIFGNFLQLHIDEVPIFIASFAYGPLMGIVVITVKTLISLPFTHTSCIGELADFLYSVAFIMPAAFIYKKNRRFKSVLIGFGVGFAAEIVVSFFFNVLVMVPFFMGGYENFNFSESVVTIGLAATLPFNAIKNALVIALTLPTYKSLHRLIDKI